MATPFTPGAGSASISGTEFSLPNGSTTLTPQTTAVNVEVLIDATAMVAGDQYRVQVLDKVNGGTAIVVWEGFITGATPQAVRVPPRRVNEGWDVRAKLTGGSARTIAWSIKEDVGDRAALTIAAGAIAAATFSASAITSTVIAASAIGATQIASAAITAAKFASDAIDATALAASAVTEIQSGLATSSSVSSVQTDVTTLTGRLTSGRAAGLDNLDSTVSSRASATAVAGVQTDATSLLGRLTAIRAGLLDNLANLDAAVSSRAAAATAVSSADLTPTRAAKLDQLDAAVTSRASTASLAAVQADTDEIQTRLPAALDGEGNMKSGVQTIAANAITAAATATDLLTAIAAAVWGTISEGAETVLHQLRLLRARELGKATVRDGDGTYTFRDAGDTKDRLVMSRSGTARTTTTADGT